MKTLLITIRVLVCILIHTNQSFSQNTFKEWCVYIAPSLNQKGVSTPNAPYTTSMHNYNAMSLQYGINYNIKIKRHSYLSIGIQRGWTTFKFLPESITVAKYPELAFEDPDPWKSRSGLFFKYNMFTLSYNLKIVELKKHDIYVGAGIAFRKYVYGGTSLNVATYSYVDTLGKSITGFELRTGCVRQVTPDITLSVTDKLKIKHITRLLISLDAHLSLSTPVGGTYSYFPNSNHATTGTYWVSGSYVGLSFGYLFNFNKLAPSEDILE